MANAHSTLPSGPTLSTTEKHGVGSVTWARQQVSQLESLLLSAVTDDAPEAFYGSWRDFVTKVAYAQSQGALEGEAALVIHELASRANVIFSNIAELETWRSEIIQAAGVKARSILNSVGKSAYSMSETTSSRCSTLPLTTRHDQPSTSTTPFDQPFRDWFATHLSHPFPSPSDITHLTSLVPPSSTDPKKLRTWFSNIRTRSGWTSIKKKWANNDPSEMKMVIKLALRGSRKVDEKCRKEVGEMRKRVLGGEETVSEELKRVLEMSKEENAEGKKKEELVVRKKGRAKTKQVKVKAAWEVEGDFSDTESSTSDDEDVPMPVETKEKEKERNVEDLIQVGEDAFSRHRPHRLHPYSTPSTHTNKGKSPSLGVGLGLPSSTPHSTQRQLSSSSQDSSETSPSTLFSRQSSSGTASTSPPSHSHLELDQFPLPPSTISPTPVPTQPQAPPNPFFATFHDAPYSQQMWEITNGQIDFGIGIGNGNNFLMMGTEGN